MKWYYVGRCRSTRHRRQSGHLLRPNGRHSDQTLMRGGRLLTISAASIHVGEFVIHENQTQLQPEAASPDAAQTYRNHQHTSYNSSITARQWH